MSRLSPLAVSVLALFAGCASVDTRASYDEVRRLVAERGIAHVSWNQSSSEDAEAAAAVRELLQHELSLEAAVQIALLGNPRLQATFEELGIAQADLVQAGLLSNPVFYGEIRFPSHPVSPLELDIAQNFLDLLLRPLRMRVAEAQLASAEAHVADAVLELAAKTRSAFFELQAAEQVLALETNLVEVQRASADAAQRLRAAGNTTDVELASEQAELSETEIELATARMRATEAREALVELMGLDNAGFSIAAALPALPAAEPETTDLETLALARRVDLAAARAEVEASARAAGFASYQPFADGITVGLHMEREPEDTTTVGPSLELPIPLFDRGQAAKARALAVLRREERRYAAMVIGARSEVRRASSRVSLARTKAERYRDELVPLRARIVEDTLRRYNAMLVGVFELLRAKRDEFEASKDAIDAVREYWIARVELERAVGGGGLEAPPAPREPERADDSHQEHHHGDDR